MLIRVPFKLAHLICLTFLVGLIGIAAVPAQSEPISQSDCLDCHDQIDDARFNASVHGANGCRSCHHGIDDLNTHSDGTAPVGVPNCAGCHNRVADEFAQSRRHLQMELSCTDCHDRIHEARKWDRKKETIADRCGQCHDADSYLAGRHGQGISRGNQDSATCTDCHGLHDVRKEPNAAGEESPKAGPDKNLTCNRCHGDSAMMTLNGLSNKAVESYDQSYHGKALKIGYPAPVARCIDCHGHHKILAAADRASSINQNNLVATCGKCHPKANDNFVKYLCHAVPTNRHKHPLLFFTFVGMTTLLFLTFFCFWVHALLWWRKTYWELHRSKTKNEQEAKAPDSTKYYRRFGLVGRLMHLVLIGSFFLLVITGLPLRFVRASWAPELVRLLGGIQAASHLHRLSAEILFFLFLGAVALSIRFLLQKKNGPNIIARLLGPDSLFPVKKDFQDLLGMVRWFFNRGPKPEFDRWTYWEKFDFLAVFWGMAAMGFSGLVLWQPEFTSRFLPGWVFNIAILVHSDEALLAAGFIFTVHFFNTHLIPGKFPLDPVIFTGRQCVRTLIAEKPLYHQRLLKTGALTRRETGPPPVYLLLLSWVIGLAAIGCGLLIFILGLTELLS